MKRACLLALLLVVPLVAAQRDQAATASPPAGNLATVFAFTLPGNDRIAPDALTNPDFSSGLDGWHVDASQVSPTDPRFEFADGLRVSVPLARAPGAVIVSQTQALDAGAYDVRLDATSDGPGVAILLRESGYPAGRHPTPFLDTLVPLLGNATLRFGWTPQDPHSTRVEVQARALYQGGDSGSVTFQRVELLPRTDVMWDFGDGSPIEHGRSVTHRFAFPGVRSVTATEKDPGKTSIVHALAVEVTNLAPIASLDVRRIGGTARFEADGSASVDPDGVETRLDPKAWEPHAEEAGTTASVDASDGVRLRAGSAQRAGTVFAIQEVPVVPGRAYDFTTAAISHAADAHYALLAREVGSPNGTFDHALEARAPADAATNLTLHVVPRYGDTTKLLLHLRLVAEAGDAVDAEFRNVKLRESLVYQWWFDGVARSEIGARLPLAPSPGNHTVTLVVTDAAGAKAWTNATLDATTPGAAPSAAILAPPLAIGGQPALLRALGSRAAPSDEMLLPDAWLTLGRASVANETATLRPGADRNAQAWQDAPIAADQAYEIRLASRGTSELKDLALLLQTFGSDGSTLSFERDALPREQNATQTRIRWTSPDPRAVSIRLTLVAAGPDGATGEVADASFAPALTYAWSVEGDASEGFGIRHVFDRTQSALVELTVTDWRGESNGTALVLPVLNTTGLRASLRLDGGAHVEWHMGSLPERIASLALVRAGRDGVVLLPLPLSPRIAYDDGSAVRGSNVNYSVLVALDNGTTIRLGDANLTLGPDAPIGRVVASGIATRGAALDASVAAPADAQEVRLTLRLGPFRVATLPLARSPVSATNWTAHAVLPRWTPPVPLRLHAEADGVELGEPAHVWVTVTGSPAGDVVSFLAVAIMLGGAWAIRAARARGWKPWATRD